MDRKSQILMSVLGVFALVIVTVGVSYAFFTYTRTGKQTNTIQSGKISFYFTEQESGINLINAMPVDETTATAATVNNSNVGTFDFKVGAVDLTGVEIDYNVSLVKQSDSTLDDSMVSLYLITDEYAGNGTITNNLASATTADQIFTSGVTEAIIAKGTIKVGGTGTTAADTYTLRMWLDSSNSNLEIHASDTNGDGVIVSGENYVVGSDDSTVTSTWGGKQYSVKVKVDTTAVRTTNTAIGG